MYVQLCNSHVSKYFNHLANDATTVEMFCFFMHESSKEDVLEDVMNTEILFAEELQEWKSEACLDLLNDSASSCFEDFDFDFDSDIPF